MDTNDSTTSAVTTSYPHAQMAKALVTALTHPDVSTQQRAEQRLARWNQVVVGMNDGSVAIGSRQPIIRFPAWVTPEVVTGGFATGTAAAAGSLLDYEHDRAQTARIARTRGALFAYCLTDEGMDELLGHLTTGNYSIGVPEEAALLVLAWLLRHGDHVGAVELLETIAPLSEELRFAPAPGSVATLNDPWVVWRRSVAEVSASLKAKRPNVRIQTMREALTVWRPFQDELLALWLDTELDGRIAQEFPDGWADRGRALLQRYTELAELHTLCGKHRNPRSNISVMRDVLAEVLRHGPDTVPPRRLGLLRCAVEGTLAKRGEPGSARHELLVNDEAFECRRPTHHEIIRVVLDRLADLPQRQGLDEPTLRMVCRSVDEDDYLVHAPGRAVEAAVYRDDLSVPEGTEIPEPIRAVIATATAASLRHLVLHAALVPSAEEMARLLPPIIGALTAADYPDAALATLMAEHYQAFRRRRSLLLLNLQHQVRITELPWVQAVEKYKREPEQARTAEACTQALRQIAEISLTGWPQTILPNVLLRELSSLARQAGLDIPLVEELAADIFMGTFTPKFAQAALTAAELLTGTVYDRYYGIDYAAVAELLLNEPTQQQYGRPVSTAFAKLCTARARRSGSSYSYSVAARGQVIEQSQILTTHNLATLVQDLGLTPQAGWSVLAQRAIEGMFTILTRTTFAGRALPLIKDAAYAWRQAVVFLSLCPERDQRAVLTAVDDQLTNCPAHVRTAARPVLDGLRDVLDGGGFDAEGRSQHGRRFLGWATDGHWMLREREVARR